jgi:outer membrane protein assembly factor BamB
LGVKPENFVEAHMTFQRTALPKPTVKTTRLITALAGAMLMALLGGCGSSKPKPTPLEAFNASARITTVWSQRVGSINGALSLAVARNTVTTASSDGEIVQFDLATGRQLWRAEAHSGRWQ